MYFLVLILPFLGATIAGFLTAYFGRKLSVALVIVCNFLAALLSLFIFYEICLSNNVVNLVFFT
jgi:NADH:ubiquinone oxidoreductase subunit 5 (subunit L)/multisubunit Na+/H+ antiporter MnhA subunit